MKKHELQSVNSFVLQAKQFRSVAKRKKPWKVLTGEQKGDICVLKENHWLQEEEVIGRREVGNSLQHISNSPVSSKRA